MWQPEHRKREVAGYCFSLPYPHFPHLQGVALVKPLANENVVFSERVSLGKQTTLRGRL